MGSSTSAAHRTCRTKPFVGFAPPPTQNKRNNFTYRTLHMTGFRVIQKCICNSNKLCILKQKAGKLSLLNICFGGSPTLRCCLPNGRA